MEFETGKDIAQAIVDACGELDAEARPSFDAFWGWAEWDLAAFEALESAFRAGRTFPRELMEVAQLNWALNWSKSMTKKFEPMLV